MVRCMFTESQGQIKETEMDPDGIRWPIADGGCLFVWNLNDNGDCITVADGGNGICFSFLEIQIERFVSFYPEKKTPNEIVM